MFDTTSTSCDDSRQNGVKSYKTCNQIYYYKATQCFSKSNIQYRHIFAVKITNYILHTLQVPTKGHFVVVIPSMLAPSPDVDSVTQLMFPIFNWYLETFARSSQ